MSGGAEEPPGLSEDNPKDPVTIDPSNSGEQDKSKLLSYRDIMMKNKVDLKKKEEAVQEYANKLSKIKSRTKSSRRSVEASSASSESPPSSTIKHEKSSSTIDDDVNDISEAKTPKAKSHLLQKKLAENRIIFEQRNKEINESNRAVEEKVEAMRQKIHETELQKENISILPVTPISILPQIATSIDSNQLHEKNNKITELNMKIHELEAIIIDLQDNLKEKDSVIDSKTKAVTLMSEDLSKKGKTTLDTLEETKDEMRVMQQHFVLMETSFKDKHDHLLGQLEEKSNRVVELEDSLQRMEDEMSKKTIDTQDQIITSDSNMLAEMRREMSAMQENFILIESSLKDKINNLILQLEEREKRLSEIENNTLSNERTTDLVDKLDKLEESNRVLVDENIKLTKTIDNLKIQYESSSNELILEKDNKIIELEKIIEEFKEKEKAATEDDKESETVQKLTKELEELNKNMIKLKAQHKSKLRNLNKRLENFKMVSDANAELVKLGNQVALLEEEKGNLQLSLVDFDELKATSGELQIRTSELENKIEGLTKDIEGKIEAIATLENQKLDLMQELHAVKQEVSALEAENADCENLRVTAELKVVELEEQLESLHKQGAAKNYDESMFTDEKSELLQRIEQLQSENTKLSERFQKTDEKSNIDSFESIEENRNELLKQVDLLTQKNQNLEMQLREFIDKGPNVEKKSSDTDSTESFERISDNNDEYTKKMTISEEKLSETSENATELHQRIENLVQENSDLVIELTKIREKYELTTNRIAILTEKIDQSSEKLSNLENENSQLKENFTKLINGKALTSLETEISNCRELNEKQIELIENIEMNLLKSQQELAIKREEVHECQLLIKNFTIIHSNYDEIERLIEDLKHEKTSVVEELRNSERMNINLSQKLSETVSESNETEKMSRERIEKLSNELGSLNEIVINRTQVLDELKLENEELKIKIDSLQNEKSLIEDENNNLKKQIESKNESIKVLEQEFQTTVGIIGEKLKDKELILMSLESQVPSLHESLADKEKLISEFQDKITSLEAIVQVQGVSGNESESKITSLEELLNEKEKTLTELRDNKTCLESVLAEKSSLIDDLRAELQTLAEKSEMNQKTINDLQDEVASLRSAVAEKQDATAALQKLEVTCRESLVEQEKLYQSCSTNLTDERTRIVELEKKNVALREQMTDLQSELLNRTSDIKRLKEEIADFMTIKNILEVEVDELKASKSSFEYHNVELSKKLNELQEQLQHLTEEKEAMHQETVHLRDVNNDLTLKVEGMEKELKDKYNQSQVDAQTINQLSSHLENWKKEINSKEELITELKGEIDALNSIITENENNTAVLQAEIMELREQLKEKQVCEDTNIELSKKMVEEKGTIDKLKIANSEINQQLNETNIRANKFQESLAEKEEILANLLREKETLLEQIEVTTLEKKEAFSTVESLGNRLKDQTKYTEEIRIELDEAYKMMELLKQKHTEDMEMQNQRLEQVMNDLQNKTVECSQLTAILDEKVKIIGENVTAQVKTDLEERIVLLERELEVMNTSSQAQLQKMKVIAANLKKKTAQYQELESKAHEFEEKWTNEKQEKEEISARVQQIEQNSSEKIHELSKALNATSITMSGIHEQVKTLQLEVEKKEKIITELQSEKQLLAETIEKLNVELTAANENIASLNEERRILVLELEKKIQELEEEIASKKALATEFESFKELTLLDQRMATESIEELKLQMISADEITKDFREQFEISAADLNSKYEEIGVLKAEMERRYEQINSITSELQMKNEELHLIKTELERKSEELHLASTKLSNKTEELYLIQSELDEKNENIRLVNTELTTKEGEVHRLKLELENKILELQTLISETESERLNKEKIIREFESFKANSSSEKLTLEHELDEAKEKARELGVRMQVMETEYVEQLNTIQTLRTHNGMLLSKHAQTNERLENTEAESNERLRNIEVLKNEIIELKNSVNQTAASCDHCNRCQSLVNALEGKLQERNAEIENLDNELANSIANFLQMRENLRTQELQCNEESQEARNTLAQYNELMNKNAEYEVKLQELNQQIVQLSEKNIALDKELVQTKELVSSAQQYEQLHLNLSQVIQTKETELEEITKQCHQLEVEKSELSAKLVTAQNEIQELPKKADDVGVPVERQEQLSAPQLFDAAKLFGTPAPWDADESTDEVPALKEQLENNEIERNRLSSRLDQLITEMSGYKEEIRLLNLRNDELVTSKSLIESELKDLIERNKSEENNLKVIVDEQSQKLINYEEEIKQINLNNEELMEHVAEMNVVKLSLQNYEKQVQDIIEERDEIIGNLKKEKEDYVGAIERFVINAQRRIPESIVVTEVTTLNAIAIQLDSILAAMDTLRQRVDMPVIVGVEEKKEVVQEEIKEEKAVEVSEPLRGSEEIKLDDDEDVWGWNSQDVELGSAMALAPFCTGEIQLKARIAELEDTIKDLEEEKLKLNEDIKLGQIRSGKLVKKLKEFKIQNESLLKQLKLQMSSGNLCDLDSAIEDELKFQITQLEKNVAEIKSDNEKVNLERDNLLKRIDVLTAANERFTEMKERQDREIEVLQIRNKELQNKIEYIEREVGENFTTVETCDVEKQTIEERSTEKYDELQESLDMLAAENEELRELIENERSERLAIELTLTERMREIEETKNQTDEMKINFDETLKKCQNLEKECIDNLDAANQRTIEVENNHEIVLGQALLRTQEIESQIAERNERIRTLEESLEVSQHHLNEAQETLANVTELLNVRVQEVAELRRQIQQMQSIQSEAERCQVHFDDLNKKLIETEKDMSRQLSQKEEDAAQKLSQKEEEITSLSTNLHEELNAKINEISLLSGKLQQVITERDALETTVIEQTQRLELLKESLDKYEWLVEAMRTEANVDKQTISSLESDLSSSKEEIERLSSSLTTLTKSFEEKREEVSEKERELQSLKEVLSSVQKQLETPDCPVCPVCKANEAVLKDIDNLRRQLSAKEEEVEDLKYILNENTYPRMLQELQDKVNALYDEKSQLETSLTSALEQLHTRGDVSVGQEAIFMDEAAAKFEQLEKTLQLKEQEIESMKKKLENKVTECTLLENALAKQLPMKLSTDDDDSSQDQQTFRELTSNELDVALYMLHQRDVRCEELTHELMQLLEERDTLQLRLSNAIRLNEELRRILPGETRSTTEEETLSGGEKISPSTSDGDTDTTELAQKLSQLHKVGHRRDIRLMDDSELRNTQQMSLLAHKDALSTLPPDAAARLINANYTLSRDVQSQSSVLLNWLWGKSTPKVVHM